jgi:dynein heavy chain
MKKKQELEDNEARCKRQLANAEKLIGGLGGEEARWKETVKNLGETYDNLVGDVLVSAGTISYLGPFTSEFRTNLVTSWQDNLAGLAIPHTENCSLENTLVDPVKLRSWQIAGLPTDTLSTQNGIIVDKASRWPLFIDPQGQANRFVKYMGKSKDFCESGMDVVKLSDANFLRSLVNGVQFGRWVLLENIGEELDAALEPILLQQKFKQGGQEMIRIGEDVIPYNDSFRFFMTTKWANPHYPPEIQVKVSLLNFTITMSGLEEQMLGLAVEEELPELAKKKVELVIANANMEKQLYQIESDILYMLSNSGDDILDDTELIDKLASAKVTSEEVKEKMIESEKLEAEIEEKSEEYRPVAKRASLLYFCIADLSTVDPMYQYSLPWFKQLFVRSVAQAPMSNIIEERLQHLNDTFTFSIYVNIC